MGLRDDGTSWEEMFTWAAEQHDESLDDIVYSTMENEEFSRKFDDGYGGTEGDPFTIWTNDRVYFPVQYDGSEWVESVPRNPCDEKTNHVGGG